MTLKKGMVVVRGEGWKNGDNSDGSKMDSLNTGIIISIDVDGSPRVLWRGQETTFISLDGISEPELPSYHYSPTNKKSSEVEVVRFPCLKSMLQVASAKKTKIDYGGSDLLNFDAITLEIGCGPEKLAKGSNQLISKVHSNLYQLGSRMAEIVVMSPSSGKVIQGLKKMMVELKSSKPDEWKDVRKKSKVERCLKVICCIFQKQLGHIETISSDHRLPQSSRVVRGPDWTRGNEDGKSEDDEEDKQGIVESYESDSDTYTVRWNAETISSGLVFKEDIDRYDIVPYSSSGDYESQFAARVMNLHLVIIKLLSAIPEDLLITDPDVESTVKLLYRTLRLMCVKNNENQTALASPQCLMSLTKFLDGEKGIAIPLLQTVLQGSATFQNVSLTFIQKVLSLVGMKVKEGSGGSIKFASKLLDLLVCVVPKPEQLGALVGLTDEGVSMDLLQVELEKTKNIDIKEALIDTKNILTTALLLKNNNEESLAVKILSPRKKKGLPSEAITSLASILMHCFEGNENLVMKYFSAPHGFPGITLNELISTLEISRMRNTGYIPRAKHSQPLLGLISVLHMHQEGIKSLTNTAAFSEQVTKLAASLSTDLVRYTSEISNSISSFDDKVFESQHPYQCSGVWKGWEVNIPGATKLKVSFSEDTQTEEGQGRIQFFHSWPKDRNGYQHMKSIIQGGALIRKEENKNSEEVGHVPFGTIIKVEDKVWYGPDDKPDPDQKQDAGFWRVKVVEPKEYAGWGSWKSHIFKPVDLEGQDLRAWSQEYSGTVFPGKGETNYLVIPSNSFLAMFKANSYSSYWGYKMAVRRCGENELESVEPFFCPYLKAIYDMAGLNYEICAEQGSEYVKVIKSVSGNSFAKAKVVETQHPYSRNMDVIFPVEINSKSGIEIIFDDFSKTEKGDDVLQFWKDEEKTELLVEDNFSGGDWPGTNGMNPLFIPDVSKFWASFKSDSATECWGFRFVVREAFPPPTPWETFLLEGKELSFFGPLISDGPCDEEYEVISEQLSSRRTPGEETILPEDEMTFSAGQIIKVIERKTVDEAVWLKAGVINIQSESNIPCDMFIGSANGTRTILDNSVDFEFQHMRISKDGEITGQGTTADGEDYTIRGILHEDKTFEFVCKALEEESKYEGTYDGAMMTGQFTLPGEDDNFDEQGGDFKLKLVQNQTEVPESSQVLGGGDEYFWVQEKAQNDGNPHVALKEPKCQFFDIEFDEQKYPNTECWSEVAFHEDTKLANGLDSVELIPLDYSQSSQMNPESNKMEISPTFSGGFDEDSYPTITKPLTLKTHKFKIKYNYRSSVQMGFRLAARPTPQPEDVFKEYRVADVIELESNMKGKEGMDQWHHIFLPQANRLAVVFSPDSQIERDSYLMLYRTDPRETEDESCWAEYDGESKLPMAGGQGPLVIKGNEIWLNFKKGTLAENSKENWKLLAFDHDVVEAKAVEMEKEISSKISTGGANLAKIFPFFENRSDSVQTIRINMPVIQGKAYYEITIGTESTPKNFLVVGWCSPDASIKASQKPNSDSGESAYCIGIGHSQDSIGVDGYLSDSSGVSHYYMEGKVVKYGDLEFKPGDVLGIQIDFPNRRLTCVLNGSSKEYIYENIHAWHKSMMPAISFMKGQSFILNCGESEFIGLPRNFDAKPLREVCAGNATGVVEIWNSVWNTWDTVCADHGIFEEVGGEEVDAYTKALISLLTDMDRYQLAPTLNLKQLLDSNKAKYQANRERLASDGISKASVISDAPSLIKTKSKLNDYLRAVGKFNKAFELLLRDEANTRLNNIGIVYPEEKDMNKPETVTIYTEDGKPLPPKAEAKAVLRKPRKELGHRLDDHLVDLCVAQLAARLEKPWSKMIKDDNLTDDLAEDAQQNDVEEDSNAIAEMNTETPQTGAALFNEGTNSDAAAVEEQNKLKQENIEAQKIKKQRLKTIENQVYKGKADFMQMFSSAISKDIFDVSPEVAMILSKTVRVLSTEYIKCNKNVVEERKKNEKKKKKSLLIGEEMEEETQEAEFVTETEMKLLVMAQKVLGNPLPGPVLACMLICEGRKDRQSQPEKDVEVANKPANLQLEGFRLANFLLYGMNSTLQKKFVAVLKGQLLDSEHNDIATNLIPSIGQTMISFVDIIGSLRGPAKLNQIAEMRILLEFLQRMCDGQFKEAQDFFGEQKTEDSENGETLLQLVVKVMEALVNDISELMKWSIDTTQFIYILKLAEQTFSALSDFVQGPHPANQKRLMDAQIFKVCALWADILMELSGNVRKALCAELPSTKSLDTSGTKQFRKLNIGLKNKLKKLKEESEDYELYCGVRNAEHKLMILIHSVLEQNSDLEVVHQAVDHLKPDKLAIQFRYHWKAALFRMSDLRQSKSTVQKLKKYLSDMKCCSSTKRKEAKANKGNLSEYISSFEREEALQLAAFHDRVEQERSVDIAFSYYVIMETVIDHFQSKDGLLSPEYLKKMVSFKDIWKSSNEYQPETVIPKSESKFYETYFGKIEVIGNDDQLQRIYFPIPWDCREQMRNPLVRAERKSLLGNVKRDNPEEQLDDFNDRGLQVQSVIEHQHRILTLSKFRTIIRFLTMRELWWVFIAYCLTLLINFIYLVEASDANGAGEHYLNDKWTNVIEICGILHLVCAVLLCFNYSIGTAQVTMNTGFKWKSMVKEGLITVSNGVVGELAFQFADLFLPDFAWRIFFISVDFMSIYYTAYFVFSLVGVFHNAAFFAFHVLDIAIRIPVMNYVMQAVAKNVAQVGSTLVLGIIFVYLFTIIALNTWGWNAYAFGDGGNEWYALGYGFLQNIDYGLRGPPVFNEPDDYNWEMYIFDFAYNILIILIMVAIITGIIIDTFADMRQAQNEISDKTRNTCFICNLPREVFERHRLKFTNHLKQDHNMWNYIFYKMYLERKSQTELTGMEAYLKEQMTSQSISYFPIKQALCLANVEKKADEMSAMKDKVTELDEKVENIHKYLNENVGGMSSSIASLAEKVEGLSIRIVESGNTS